MKWVFAILALFFISFAFNSQSRELTFAEKGVLIGEAKTLRVKSQIESSLAELNLPFQDYLSYQILKKACVALDIHKGQLARAAVDYPDQSAQLIKSYGLCAEGTLGLVDMYLRLSASEE